MRRTGHQPGKTDYYLSNGENRKMLILISTVEKISYILLIVVKHFTWIAVPISTLALCWFGPNHFMTLLPGSVDLNAIRTTTVLARRHEMQRAKLIPNAGYRMRQSQSEGSPMNNRPTRKQIARNTKKRKLNSMLFARTNGVSLYMKNMERMERVIHAPRTDTTHRTVPINSW